MCGFCVAWLVGWLVLDSLWFSSVIVSFVLDDCLEFACGDSCVLFYLWVWVLCLIVLLVGFAGGCWMVLPDLRLL